MGHSQDHTIISLKMVIGYLDSLFNETRPIITNPQTYKLIPVKMLQKYSELENQYALVERKLLNFHNLMLLKRFIEAIWRKISGIGDKFFARCPEGMNQGNFSVVEKIEDEMQPCKRLTADGEELNLIVSDKKEILDWDFSELNVDPHLEKDRIVMNELKGHKLVKISKLNMIYDISYLEEINAFLMQSTMFQNLDLRLGIETRESVSILLHERSSKEYTDALMNSMSCLE